MPDSSAEPSISVVIPSRDRESRPARTVASVLQNEYPSFEVILVDQSDSDATTLAVEEFVGDSRFRHVRSETVGVSRARNIGIGLARGEIIAHTDDDCEARRDWLSQTAKAFSECPEADILFGCVVAGTHPTERGFIPTYRIDKPMLVRAVWQKHKAEGIGACMAYRKSVAERLHGFDEKLGAGSYFRSAEELDFTIRALRRGHSVYETPDVQVAHCGFRTWSSANRVIAGHLFGIGGMFAKHLRCGHWAVLVLFARLAVRWLFRGPAVDFGVVPPRMLRLKAFARGFFTGATKPVNRETEHYTDWD